MRETILVTGGAGYIGSHTTLVLMLAGYDVVVLDNLCNSSVESLHRVAAICGRMPIILHGDIRSANQLDAVFAKYPIDAVLHFAGLKAVGESVRKPLEYYDINVGGSVSLCQAMARAGVYRLVFSSSATVYGATSRMPLQETSPTSLPTNPYGRTKLIVEEMLRDLAVSDPRWSIALLRYFNPIGAHKSGLIGDDPNGIPNNLLPYLTQVAVGRLEQLSVFGDDYPTRDGTGVRDYIHVMDLAEGHARTLEVLRERSGVSVWNLGTGVGHSVLEVIDAFQRASRRTVPYRIMGRRPGDVAECWADPSRSALELGWEARRGLDEMMQDAWRWQSAHPNGYACTGEATTTATEIG